jgi:uroporphyrinogen III methyltransferase/synthase
VPSDGVVHLVGAGPGDPGLLTRRGEALLRRAEVVVYDRLVAPELLRLCRAGAQLVYVGKEAGGDRVSQDEINRLLVELGRSGREVVRLKGGDPFVFGRGGEEALALRSAGVPFEIVPGVSSALAAPACAGIPVTHRGLAASVTIATGHEDPRKPESSIAWSQLANGADTLVFLMGVEQLPAITERLLAAGRSPDEPAALVRWGTTSEQETLIATLVTVADQARARDLKPPAVLVVGRVVDLQKRLSWREARPLHGRRVLVTRAREQASALSERLAELGARPLEFPGIRIEPLRDASELDAALARLGQFSWVILTSANGVRAAFERLAAAGRDARAFGGLRVGAIGPATAAALAERGIRADFIPTAFTSEAIASELAPLLSSDDRILLLRADIAPRVLVDQLGRSGAAVENVTAYRTVPDLGSRDEVRQLLRSGQIDVVTFTSSSTVRNLVDVLGDDRHLLSSCLVACIGPVTAATASERGLRVDVVAPLHTIEGLVEALVEALSRPARPLGVRS